MPSLKRFRKILSGEPTKEIVEETHEVVKEPTKVQDEVTVAPIIVSETPTETLSSKLKSVFGFQKATLTVEEHADKIKAMTKAELDQYAEKYDIYLDRRQTKPNMINEFIQKLKEKQ